MRVLLVSVLLFLATIPPASATIINVPGDSATIQEGINGASDGDTVLVARGTYYERINFYGKGITVASNYIYSADTLDIQNTIIDADTSVTGYADTGSAVCFINSEDSTSILHGFTIRNGTGTDGYGGGIYLGQSSPRILYCDINNNSASLAGGGIYGLTSNSYIYKCRISNNSSSAGGGMASRGYDNIFTEDNSNINPVLDSCVIRYNDYGGLHYDQQSAVIIIDCAVEYNSGDGIRIPTGGTSYGTDISGCTIGGNSGNGIAPSYVPINGQNRIDSVYSHHITGCAIEDNAGTGIIAAGLLDSYLFENCDFRNNTEGIRLISDVWDVSVNSCVFIGNGYCIRDIASNSVNIYVENCLFADNAGEVIYFRGEGAYIEHSTFVNNLAGDAVIRFTTLSEFSLENSIIAFNYTGAAISFNAITYDAVISCTDIFDNEGGDWTDSIAQFAGINGNFSLDPQFCDAANNNYSIFSTSPCAPENNSCDTLIGVYDVNCLGMNDFHLIQPAVDSIFANTPIDFLWEASQDADSGFAASYIVYIDDSPVFDSPYTSATLTDTTYSLSDTLSRSMRHYWRVAAFNDYAPPNYSAETRSIYFEGYPSSPDPFTPVNGTNADSSTLFSWVIGTDPDTFDVISYTIEIDEDSLFASPEINQSGLGNSLLDEAFAVQLGQLQGVENLQMDTRYYWRVRSDDSYGLSSPWPDSLLYFTYSRLNHPPNPPDSGFSPANGEEIISLNPLVTWNAADDPDPDDTADSLFYDFYLFEDTSTGGQEYRDTTTQGTNQIVVTDTLHDNAHFYYQVRTIDDGGLASPWSVLQNFWTNHYDYPPEPFPLYSPDPDHTRVVMNTEFVWGNTVDLDPGSSFTFILEYCPDSLFMDEVNSTDMYSDTAAIILTDLLTISGWNIYWRVLAIDDDSLIRTGGIPEEIRRIRIIPPGDANSSGGTDGSDITFLVGYLKGLGPAPLPLLAGDANGDCTTNGSDVIYLVNFFKDLGPPPVRPDCEQAVSVGDFHLNASR
jgi:hypothetical protein